MVRYRPWVAAVAPSRRSPLSGGGIARRCMQPGRQPGDRCEGARPAVRGRCGTQPTVTFGADPAIKAGHAPRGHRSSLLGGDRGTRAEPAIHGRCCTQSTIAAVRWCCPGCIGRPRGDERREGVRPAVGGRRGTGSVIMVVGSRCSGVRVGACHLVIAAMVRGRPPTAVVAPSRDHCTGGRATSTRRRARSGGGRRPPRSGGGRRRRWLFRPGAGGRPGTRCHGRAPAPTSRHRSARSRRPGRTLRPSRRPGTASTPRPTRRRRRRTRTSRTPW